MVALLALVLSVLSVAGAGAVRDYAKLPDVPYPATQHTVEHGRPSAADTCAVGTYIAWSASLGAGGLSAPVVADFDNDGQKEVIWNTMSVFVEALVASDGEKVLGWPLPLSDSLMMAAPLLYDIDGSGTLDVLVATEAGEIVFVEQSGVPLYNATLKIGPLPLSRSYLTSTGNDKSEAARADDQYWELLRRRDVRLVPNRYRNRGRLAGQMEHHNDHVEHELREKRANVLPEESDMTAAGLKSLELFLSSTTPDSYVEGVMMQLDPLYSPTYLELTWDETKEVLVPPHVLTTPIICDLERDGHDELIVGVSYFFSATQTMQGALFGLKTGDGTEAIAVAGLVAFDLHTRTLKWQVELGATRATDGGKAYVYAPPVAADLDGDGTLELVVADGSGHVHVVDAAGNAVAPWPIRLASIASQPVVEDLNGDGKMEIVVLDARGNLVCFDLHANEMWLFHVYTGSEPALDHAPTVGDINNDGTVDVVIGTAAGLLYAVDGVTGVLLPGYPVVFPSAIRAEVALAKLNMVDRGLHLVVPAGTNLYIVNGANPACLDSVTLGEESYAPVAIDDFTGDGRIDFLVTCASGHVFCLSTEVPYHPLNTWSTPWSGGTKVATNFAFHGIFALNRAVRDVSGGHLPLRFEIVDRRPRMTPAKGRVYNVTVSINGIEAYTHSYLVAGRYLAHVPVPLNRSSATVTLWMENEAHQVFTDFFCVSFNVKFHRLLKYVLLFPFALLVLFAAWSESSVAAASAPLPLGGHA